MDSVKPPSLERQMTLRNGFSLMEALVSVTVTTMACAALVQVVYGLGQASSSAISTTVARGICQQLMDEISLARFPLLADSRPTVRTMGTVPSRLEFNDLDDYAGYIQSPPADRNGRLLGHLVLNPSATFIDNGSSSPDLPAMNRFLQEVFVERVQQGTGSTWPVATSETGFRRVTVRVRELTAPFAISETGSTQSGPLPPSLADAPIITQSVRIMAYVPPAP